MSLADETQPSPLPQQLCVLHIRARNLLSLSLPPDAWLLRTVDAAQSAARRVSRSKGSSPVVSGPPLVLSPLSLSLPRCLSPDAWLVRTGADSLFLSLRRRVRCSTRISVSLTHYTFLNRRCSATRNDSPGAPASCCRSYLLLFSVVYVFGGFEGRSERWRTPTKALYIKKSQSCGVG